MEIIIRNLTAEKFEEINEMFGCGNWYRHHQFEELTFPEDDPTLTVTLDDDRVSMTIRKDDRIVLEKSAWKVEISAYDFSKIEII